MGWKVTSSSAAKNGLSTTENSSDSKGKQTRRYSDEHGITQHGETKRRKTKQQEDEAEDNDEEDEEDEEKEVDLADNDNNDEDEDDDEGDKKADKSDKDQNDDDDDDDDDDEDDEDEVDTINVDFDFNDIKEIDFHGIKTLLNQVFGADIEQLDASAIADLLIEQKHIGSTTKADGSLDPYALLTKTPCVKQITDYILSKTKKNADAHSQLSSVIAKSSGVGFVISERLINMPPQIAPPMFKMLLEEIEWAVEDGKPFKFEYLIFISKIYREVESSIDQEMAEQEASGSAAPATKKSKKTKQDDQLAFYFQPEDEVIEKHAELSVEFKLPQQQSSDSRRAFHEVGIAPSRRIFLVKFAKMPHILKEIQTLIGTDE
eukprot:jgi/Hompol1/4361/HPOL_003595-RA